MAPPYMHPSLLRFLFLNLCWVAFLFPLIRVCGPDPGPPPKTSTGGGASPVKYDKKIALDGKQVTFYWTLSKNKISIKAKAKKKSGYLAIGFGTEMITSYAYVGWFDKSGKGKVSTYWIGGKDPNEIHATKENLTNVRCKSENGMITFEFTRALKPHCNTKDWIECGNLIDPKKPLKVIWAMGPKWSEKKLSKSANMHFATSKTPTVVMLRGGTCKADDGLPLPFIVHGILMALAWGLILPAGVGCARYLKHLNGDKWFKLHIYLQCLGLVLIVVAFVFVVVTMKGVVFDKLHVKFGYVAILLGVMQPVNALFRPEKPSGWNEASTKRVVWEYIHMICGRCSIIVAFAALITGLRFLKVQYVQILTYVFIGWICLCVVIVIFLEIRKRKNRRSTSIKEFGVAQLVDDEITIAV